MMAVSNETAARADHPIGQPIIDPNNDHTNNTSVAMPSETVKPTRSDTTPQQAATQPGDGTEVHEGDKASGKKVPFKQRVVGAAQKARGTLLGKPLLKEHGNKVLDGTAPAERPTTFS